MVQRVYLHWAPQGHGKYNKAYVNCAHAYDVNCNGFSHILTFFTRDIDLFSDTPEVRCGQNPRCACAPRVSLVTLFGRTAFRRSCFVSGTWSIMSFFGIPSILLQQKSFCYRSERSTRTRSVNASRIWRSFSQCCRGMSRSSLKNACL